ncbi:acetyl esterase/lipase [Azorhizobium sp. AG788]|uniref:alpha/beta hydrolase fold domain-containing protein n=1 Tax=Azorhizobium sp. AG788 TaxID=2183897 RepID=UPI0010620360|nr:alpha/beta hydrolase fold domain-containing protein [Azorhizobium sp. AG788]TDT96441.1 acetyl esterase/lipase [Azorhizobium sp. AG788]
MTVLSIDPHLFTDAAVAPDTKMVNAAIVKALSRAPDLGLVPWAVVRQARLSGKGTFPLPPESPRARNETIEGPRGPVPVRIYLPDGAPAGVYLHFHGGGWTIGSARENDGLNDAVAAAGLVVVSVDYALAPETPYPAAPDDCEAAALWLLREGLSLFGTDRFLIGGESAGAHLAVTTLLRLRDRHGISPFVAASLHAGCYDLRLTPSARNWGTEPLVLNTADIERFVRNYLRLEGEAEHPDVSPLLADLKGLPKAQFLVGTRDPLLDDTLFMANRWLASGNPARLEAFPGGCHVFMGFVGSLADKGRARIVDFLRDA